MKYLKPYLKSMLLFNLFGLIAFGISSIIFLDLAYLILGIIIVPPATILSGIFNAVIDYLRSKSKQI